MQAQDSFTVGPADVQAATKSGRLSHISNGYDCLQVMPSGADTIPFRSLPSAPNAVSESHEAASTLAPTPALKRKAPAAEVQQAPMEARLHVRRRLLKEDNADSGV